MLYLPRIARVASALLVASVLLGAGESPDGEGSDEPATALSFEVESIEGESVDLAQYRGDVVLIVNTASRCGFTKQYAGLQSLYEQHREAGFVVLGFPCNQFKNQEPGSDEEIATFCEKNYGVTFPLFSKIEVNGDDAAPLYRYLTGEEAGLEDAGPVKWNFEKFLIGRDGRVIARYRSKVAPESEELQGAVAEALAAEAPPAS